MTTVQSVEEPGPVPILIRPPQSARINENESVRFTCHVLAKPPANVTWYINGQPVPNVGELVSPSEKEESEQSIRPHQARFDGLMHHLEMRKCRPDESGQILVIARRSDMPREIVDSSPENSTSATVTLEVVPVQDLRAQLRPVRRSLPEAAPIQAVQIMPAATPSGRIPYFTRPLQPTTVVEGSLADLYVEFESEPSAEIKWFRNGLDISSNPDYKITTTELTSHLVISETFQDDSGTVMVTATNPLGQASTMGVLHVTPAIRLTPVRPVTVGQPPQFLPPLLQDGLFNLGEPVTLESKVIGEPLPEVKWERNGQLIQPTEASYLRRFDEPPFHTLLLCETRPEDAGLYKCIATNPHGQAVCAAQIVVELPPEPVVQPMSPPVILEAPKDITVSETQSVVLQCRVKGTPISNVLHFGLLCVHYEGLIE
ncbi:unnamed protein product [Protopolystoma xenopodis]|uniref:Ig-like domain-containing protein n=1 Tax=Protopolystoma xenopodis TaxID=117903 RepID=A0A3S5BKH1_9PLAT|nr:unnamed protein product [Protopolystoma xenopodis]